MTTYTFNLVAGETKGSYLRYEHMGRSVYVPKTMASAAPPATITITGEGLAEPKVAKVSDPVALEAAATKAAERAQRAADRAQKLAEQLTRMKAQQPASPIDQPAAKAAGRGKKAKAA